MMEKREWQDPLMKYFEPERIEKAPEGFTGNIMTRIGLEANTVHFKKERLRNIRVPVISVIVIGLLVLAAVLVPLNQTDTLLAPVVRFISNLGLSMPDLPVLKGSSGLHFPDWTIYGCVGLVVIALVDKGLSYIFHRTGK
jgi:hypothetical protein